MTGIVKKRGAVLLVVLLAAALLVSVHSTSVLLVDSSQDTYLMPSGPSVQLSSSESLTSLVASLTGLAPGVTIDGQASDTVRP